jgi:hypothetical protein
MDMLQAAAPRLGQMQLSWARSGKGAELRRYIGSRKKKRVSEF